MAYLLHGAGSGTEHPNWTTFFLGLSVFNLDGAAIGTPAGTDFAIRNSPG